ncbi:MAG TPA: CPBP family intramembrane glutamic endopeptidase, partial [Pyrinomonadaceae bacterium]|nr:CPBP family intramembrane glutamic endopeptidase [Pyrinomonadaceae bacterium]
DFAALMELIPVPPGAEVLTIDAPLKLLSLVQPTVLLALAVFIGVRLAPQVGLSAPFTEALAAGRGDASAALRRQIMPGALGGLAGGALIVLTYLLFRPLLLPETVALILKFSKLMPAPIRFLYGGITEELLLRWGFMTLLVWLAWRLIQRKRGNPGRATFIGAILISALLFGIGHLPIAFLLFPRPEPVLIIYVIIANSIFGLIAGYLYWKKGLESAMLAHMVAHVVMLAARDSL